MFLRTNVSFFIIVCLYFLFLNTGGLSDPYFTIRKAFGPGYTPPNKDSQGRDSKPYYEGKHKDPPFLKSEYITKDLNPSWKTCAIDLERCGIGLVVNNNKTSLKYSILVSDTTRVRVH